MKRFSCGDIVVGCQATFEAEDETSILDQIAQHAQSDHGMERVPDELVEQVKDLIRDE